ncbi:MAG: fibronectin type III domain-containing protein [Paludibacter sp.]
MNNQNSTLTSCLSSSIRQFALFLCCMFFTVEAYAVTVTFNGTTDTDWATATNWDLGTVPTSADVVVIATSKSVVIANGTTVSVEKITLNAGASLTNNGTLTIAPGLNTAGATTGSALTISGTNTFDNEGTLTITSANQTSVSNAISLNGTGNTLTFNGTNNLAAKAGSNNVFAAGGSSSTTISGTGFTIGSSTIGATFIPFSITSTGATITIDTNTTINLYIGSSTGKVGFYLASSVSIINNGTLNIYTKDTGTNPRAISVWQTSANGYVATFTNYGTLLMSGFEQPTSFSGSGGTSYSKFENKSTGIVTSTYPGISSGTSSGTIGISSAGNLPNIFINSGTMNLNASYRAIALSAKTYGGSFTNTGTINITKGSIQCGGTLGTSTTYQAIDNNSGGVINFNYGVSAGTSVATDRVIINNNSGATINGSCTFPQYTLVTAVGSTLSPGDYTAGVSGIGTIVLKPSVAGTKFPLSGSVLMQIKGKTTPGTDFDKISCTELDVTNATLTVTADYTSYTPAVNDYLVLIYSGTSKTGPFSSTSMPRGWLYESTTTNEAAKYYPSVPSMATSVVATTGNAQASVAFSAPASDGGADITLYTVTSNDGITATGTASPIVVTGLTNETAYTFTVTATNIRGTSVASAASNSVTPSVNTAIVNQSADKIMITVEGRTLNLHGAIGMVNVFNSVGGLVLSEKTSNRNIEMKSKGIYLIKLETAQGIKVQKVLVN